MKLLEHQLESLIDQHGVVAVLKTISDICWGKATDIAEHAQDASNAKLWSRAAVKILRTSRHADVLPVAATMMYPKEIKHER
jgi:hypothetical protein